MGAVLSTLPVPRTCRIYPLTVGPGERGRDFEYCLCLDRHQSHFTGGRVSVKDWLYQNFKREDKEYVKREYEIATELGKLMRAIDLPCGQALYSRCSTTAITILI